jgi:hypothetical protein
MQITKNAPNSSFWVSKNYFKYIRPGAVRVDTKSDNQNLLVTAFENTDGKFAMVVINKGKASVSARLIGNNLPEKYHVYRTSANENCIDAGDFDSSQKAMIFPAETIITMVADVNIPLTINQVGDTTVTQKAGEIALDIAGIGNTAGSTSGLKLTAENSNSTLFSKFEVSAITSDGKAKLNFTPATDKFGNAQVQLILNDDKGNKRTVTFFITITEVVGIKNVNIADLNIYPNPARDILNIRVSAGKFEKLNVRDITGRMLYQQSVEKKALTLNVNNWNKGVYLIELSGKTGTVVSRFVVE